MTPSVSYEVDELLFIIRQKSRSSFHPECIHVSFHHSQHALIGCFGDVFFANAL